MVVAVASKNAALAVVVAAAASVVAVAAATKVAAVAATKAAAVAATKAAAAAITEISKKLLSLSIFKILLQRGIFLFAAFNRIKQSIFKLFSDLKTETKQHPTKNPFRLRRDFYKWDYNFLNRLLVEGLWPHPF
jgi:hypothetical protein